MYYHLGRRNKIDQRKAVSLQRKPLSNKCHFQTAKLCSEQVGKVLLQHKRKGRRNWLLLCCWRKYRWRGVVWLRNKTATMAARWRHLTQAAEFSRQMEPIWLFRRGRAAGRHCSSSYHRVRLPINTEVGPTNSHNLNFRRRQVLTGWHSDLRSLQAIAKGEKAVGGVVWVSRGSTVAEAV